VRILLILILCSLSWGQESVVVISSSALSSSSAATMVDSSALQQSSSAATSVVVPILGAAVISSSASAPTVKPLNKKHALAVLPFECNVVTEEQGRILADQVRNSLQKLDSFQVVERGQMDLILQEQGFQQSGVCNSSGCAVQAGQLMGVDQVVAGSVGKLGDLWLMTLRRIDVESGLILQTAEVKIEGRIEDLLLTGVPQIVRQVGGLPVVRVADSVALGSYESAFQDRGFSARIGVGIGATFGMAGINFGLHQQWRHFGIGIFGTANLIPGVISKELVGEYPVGLGLSLEGPLLLERNRPTLQFNVRKFIRTDNDGDVYEKAIDYSVLAGGQSQVAFSGRLMVLWGAGIQYRALTQLNYDNVNSHRFFPTGNLGLLWVF